MHYAKGVVKLLLPFFLFAALAAAQKPIPVIFDTDIGDDIDDALALALALQSPELDVRGVTTVTDYVEERSRLAWKELGLYHRHDVPLATGIGEPLLDPIRIEPMGQFRVLTDADVLPEKARRRAVEFLVTTLMESKEKITLVPVGPLTNIAMALRLEPRIKDKIERIVLMGGAFQRLFMEYNIRRDRAAAAIVFHARVPITAVGLDVTLQCKLEGRDLEQLRAAENPASKFLVRLIELWQNGNRTQYPTLHDPLAVAAVIRPSLLTTDTGRVDVETNLGVGAGLTVFTRDSQGQTQVAKTVDVRGFLDLFIARLSAPPR